MKAQFLVTIDADLLIELRNKNINKSELINNFLRSYLNMKETTSQKPVIETEITKLKAQIVQKETQLKAIEEARLKKRKAEGWITPEGWKPQ